jgi:hypothetical protein
MSFDEFVASLGGSSPPDGIASPLAALWYQRKGHFDTAHGIVQGDACINAAWVHAYLHRLEGDPGNAGYWYNRAGRQAQEGSLANEWDIIARAMLAS